MIQVSGLSVQLAGAPVLKNISVNIPNGEVHVLLGASGSGKSTLLRVLAGLIRSYQGEVQIGSLDPSQAAPLGISQTLGYVIQEGGLFPHMSIQKNLAAPAKVQCWEDERIDLRTDELFQLVGLSKNLLNRYPHQLSGGQRQRVALCRALFCNPEYLLLDESLGALDPITRFELQEDLKKLFKKLNKTVLLVTHDLAEAFYLGDRVSVLHQGRLLQSDSPQDLVKSPRDPYIKRFIEAQRWQENGT